MNMRVSVDKPIIVYVYFLLVTKIQASFDNFRISTSLSVYDSPAFLINMFKEEKVHLRDLMAHTDYKIELYGLLKETSSVMLRLGRIPFLSHSHLNIFSIKMLLRILHTSKDQLLEYIEKLWTIYNKVMLHSTRRVLENITYNHPESPDLVLDGSLLGLLLIIDTYGEETERIENKITHLQSQDKCVGENILNSKSCKSVHYLNVLDHLAIAWKCVKIKWYRYAIFFARYGESQLQTHVMQKEMAVYMMISIIFADIERKSEMALNSLSTNPMYTTDMPFLPFSSRNG